MNLLTKPTACTMVGCVVTITYIKEPIIGPYGTKVILSPFGPDLEQSLHENLRLADSGIVVDRAVFMLNRSRIGQM